MLNFLCRKRYAITNKVWIRSPSCSPSYPGGRKALLLVWPLLWQWRVMKLCVCNKKRPQELLWLAPRWKKNKKRLPLLLGGVYFVVIIIRFSHFIPHSLFQYRPLPCRLLCEKVNHDGSFHLVERGPVQMKGRAEPMQCWFLSRATKATTNPTSPYHAIKTTRAIVETEV